MTAIRPATSAAPAAQANPQTYTVKSGDTLSRIAQRQGTSVKALVQLNGIANPDLIFPGQRLKLPAAPAPAKPEPKPAPKVEAKPADRVEDKKPEPKVELQPPAKPGAKKPIEEAKPTKTEGAAKLDAAGLPQTHAAELKKVAEDLYAKGHRGVDLSSRVMASAVAHYDQQPGLTSEQKHDAVMRDSAIVFMGPSAKTMLDYYRNASNGQNALVETMYKSLEGLDLAGLQARGFEGKNGRLGSDDFKAAVADGTDNQIYHTFNYTWLRYATGDGVGVLAGNMKHELLDGGNTVEDYQAGLWGAEIGERYRASRDSQEVAGFKSLPTLWGSTLSKDGASYGNPEQPWNGGSDFRDLAERMDSKIKKDPSNTGNWFEGVVTRFGAGVVDFVAEQRKEDPKFNEWISEFNKDIQGKLTGEDKKA
jgi:LysM repeat protein